MIRIPFYFVFLCCVQIFLATKLIAQKKIQVNGADSLSLNYLKQNPLNINDSSEIESACNTYINKAIEQAYLTATIKKQYSDSSLILILCIGNNYESTNNFILQSNYEWKKYVGIRTQDSIISLHKYLKTRNKIIDYYADRGYPFAEITFKEISIKEHDVKATLVCNTKNNIVFGDILLTSDGIQINKNVLKNLFDIKTGESYSKTKINDIPTIINELAFIELKHQVKQVINLDSSIDIECNVKSKPSNQFDGIIGFSSDNANNNNLSITGKIAIELNNMFKQAEKIITEWEKIGLMSQKLLLSAQFRYILNTALGVEPSLTILKQDSTFLNTDMKLSVPYSLLYNKVWKFSVYKSTSSVINNENVVTTPLADINKTGYGIGYKIWKYDNMYNPRQGYIVNIETSGGNKTYTIPNKADSVLQNIKTKTNFIHGSFQAGVYIPISKQTALLIENKSALIQSSSLYKNECLRIGGFKTLRGFDENSLFCTRYALLNIEYRLLFQKSSNVFVFWNGMTYENKAIKPKVNDTPMGFGLGLNIQSRNSIFSITYAYGKQFNNKIMFNLAKVHFGYITVF